MTDFENARALGIGSEVAQGFFPYSEDAQGRIHLLAVDDNALANDAALSTQPNVGAPASLYTYLDPRVIEVLYGVTAASKIFEKTKYGDFEDDFATFMVEDVAGRVSPYSDHGDGVTADVNYDFPVRQNFRYQTTIQYGDLEVSKMARAKVNLAARKQYAAATVMARAENSFQLYGVKGMEVYGLLNDPNLDSPLAPISVGGKSTWADKVAAQPDTAANVVFNDINKLIGALMGKNGGLVDANADFVLAVSNKVFAYLTQPNSFGQTALGLLKANYPRIRVEQLPELSTASGETLYLTVSELLGEKTGFTAFSRAYMLGRLVPGLSCWEQKATAGTWGAVIRRPSLVALMTGV